jgi:hypothetical protein
MQDQDKYLQSVPIPHIYPIHRSEFLLRNSLTCRANLVIGPQEQENTDGGQDKTQLNRT